MLVFFACIAGLLALTAGIVCYRCKLSAKEEA